jgi:hypothetical protein
VNPECPLDRQAALEIGIVGSTGVLTIDDTHRDIVLAVSKPQQEGYAPDETRLVDFMGSYPPGDMALGELRPGGCESQQDSFHVTDSLRWL